MLRKKKKIKGLRWIKKKYLKKYIFKIALNLEKAITVFNKTAAIN